MSVLTSTDSPVSNRGARSAVAATNPVWIRRWWYVLLLLVVMWAPVIAGLLYDWDHNPNYSHGFLIPFAIAYFLWRKRAKLAAAAAAPSWLGAVVMCGALAVYAVGLLAAEFFLQRCAMLLFLAGMVVFLWGWRCLRETLFVFTLAFLAVPLPAIIFNAVAFPLQLKASALSAGLLRAVGIPVFQQGNILQLPTQVLNVAEACSGIRSLISLITLALMVAWFLPLKRWVQVLFVASAVPIAILANALRIALTGILGRYLGPQYSEGFFHLFSGWIIFLVAFALMLGESSLLGKVKRFSQKGQA